jgi:hypothetical protein
VFAGQESDDIGSTSTLVLQKAVTPGSWVVVVSGTAFAGSVEDDVLEWDTVAGSCELRTDTGGFLGEVGFGHQTDESFFTGHWPFTLNGGVFVPAGQVQTIQLYCQVSVGESGRIEGSRLVAMQVGGFS